MSVKMIGSERQGWAMIAPTVGCVGGGEPRCATDAVPPGCRRDQENTHGGGGYYVNVVRARLQGYARVM